MARNNNNRSSGSRSVPTRTAPAPSRSTPRGGSWLSRPASNGTVMTMGAVNMATTASTNRGMADSLSGFFQRSANKPSTGTQQTNASSQQSSVSINPNLVVAVTSIAAVGMIALIAYHLHLKHLEKRNNVPASEETERTTTNKI